MRSWRNVFTMVAFVIAAGVAWSGAAVAQTEFKITAGDASDAAQFGAIVDISGDYAVVGAPYHDENSVQNSGAAYIFKRTGSTTWGQRAKLTGGGTASDHFGQSVAIDGDYVVVSAGEFGNNARGSVYIFKRTGNIWTQQRKLTASDAADHQQFGSSVAISGDYIIVGANSDDNAGNGAGSAYVFTRNGTSWTQQAKFIADDAASEDNFGYRVSISGDYAIVGALGNDDAGTYSGSAYIFKRNDTSWSQQAKITASDGAELDYFGSSVSISGAYAIVGAYGDDDDGNSSGSAYIFSRTGTAWTEQFKLTASDAESDAELGDLFGVSVSIDGNTAIVGAIADVNFSGSSYIFKRDGTNWTEQAKLVASDAAEGDRFGRDVSISGDYVIVGAEYAGDAGSAYLFGIPIPAVSAASRMSFDDVVVGTSKVDSVKVKSTGTAALLLSAVTVTGADSASFTATPATLSVATGDSAYIKVTFTPSSAGDKTALLLLTHNAVGSPTSIDLTGVGGQIVTDIADTLTFTSDDGSNTKVKFESGTVTGIFVSHHDHGRNLPASTDGSSAPTIPLTYFEINTTLADTVTFEAMVSFQYTQALLDSAGITDETTLKLFRYDAGDGIWVQLVTSVETSTKTVSATTNSFSVWSLASVTPTGIYSDNMSDVVPHAFSLATARPNPFNPSTTIAYEVPEQTQITLTIYNLLGQKVIRLVDQVQAAGRYEVVWHGNNSRGVGVASGVYLYRIVSGSGYTDTKRMTLLK